VVISDRDIMLRLTNCDYKIRNIYVVTCDRDIMLRLTNCDYSIRNISVVTCDRDIMLRLTNCDYNIRNIYVVTCDRDSMLRLINCHDDFKLATRNPWFCSCLVSSNPLWRRSWSIMEYRKFNRIDVIRIVLIETWDYQVKWYHLHRGI